MDPIEEFIAGYDAAAFQRIRFAWNGLEGAEGGDLNIGFRKDVLAVVRHVINRPLRNRDGAPAEGATLLEQRHLVPCFRQPHG